MRSIANLMKIHRKSRPDEDNLGLTAGQTLLDTGSSLTIASMAVASESPQHQLVSGQETGAQESDGMLQAITTPVCVDKLPDREYNFHSHKCQDFQVFNPMI